jgi:FkbM family methyltransferase
MWPLVGTVQYSCTVSVKNPQRVFARHPAMHTWRPRAGLPPAATHPVPSPARDPAEGSAQRSPRGCLLLAALAGVCLLGRCMSAAPTVAWFKTAVDRPCQSLYVDLGSNIGVQVRKLFEPSKYPDAAVLPFFDQFFGPVDLRRQNTCAFGVEANPKHTKRLQEIEQAYRAQGWRTTFTNNVVLDVDGTTIDFYTEDRSQNEDWAAGITTKYFNLDSTKITTYKVLSVDIARWLADLLKNHTHRPLPVFIKLDIEGAEFRVLPHLLAQGLLCKDRVSAVVVEFHGWARPANNTLTFAGFEQQVKQQKCQPTQIVQLDDETYVHDRKGLPASLSFIFCFRLSFWLSCGLLVYRTRWCRNTRNLKQVLLRHLLVLVAFGFVFTFVLYLSDTLNSLFNIYYRLAHMYRILVWNLT